MSEPVDQLSLTLRTRSLKDQAARFDEAWQRVARGGEPPSIDEYLAEFTEPDRTRLIRELQQIERTHLVHLSFGKADTIEVDGDAPTPQVRPLETHLMLSDSPGDASNRAAATEPASKSPAGDVQAEIPSGPPDASMATMRLPGSFPEPSDVRSIAEPDLSPPSSVHLPLLDSWGRDVEPPPIAGTLRSIVGPRPYLKGYEIIGELGRGGMGVVYKANQQGLNRLVAIKMVLGGDHAREEDLVRFKIEAEAVASIQHPNIVQIYEVGEKDGTPYFSLEFIDGGTLHQQIDGKPMPHDQAAEIAHQLAQAMAHFHDRGVIHRDMKPANVLMTLHGSPKITDFGLAKRLEGNSSQTRTGSLMGTPSYMAPEQASGDIHAIGPLSDLYSLGAVLYEMLTGRPPFQGATMLDTIDQVRSQEPVPPRRLQPKIPVDLETICLKCLQKEPSKRYPGATELAEDLRHYLEGEPIKARPIGRVEMGWRWARRNPRVAILSLSIFLLGLMLTTLSVLAAGRMAREAQTVNDARLIASDRFERGRAAIEAGNLNQAIEIIGLPDPFVERTPALYEIRDRLRTLREQLKTLAEFRLQLDLATYEGVSNTDRNLDKASAYFRELIAFYDEIEARKGRGAAGLPPLSESQLQLFKEDVFDMFLIAALVESDRHDQKKNPKAATDTARIALKWLDRAEKLLPPTRALYSRRIYFRQVLGDQAGAEEDDRKARSIEPTSPVDLYWRGYKDRLSAEDVLAKNPRKFEEFIRQARDNFTRHLLARPDHISGWLEWATCNYGLKEWNQALLGFNRCAQLNPGLPWPYHNRADAQAKLGYFSEAILDETRAIDRDPAYLDAYFGRSDAYWNLGKAAEAIVDLDQAIRIATKEAEASNDPDQAKRINARKGEMIFRRGVFHYSVKNYEAALADFDITVKGYPRSPDPYQSRGWVRYFLRDIDGAIADMSVVASLRPEDFEARHHVGVFQMGLRHYDEALQALNDCLKVNPDYVLSLLAKSKICHWRGDDAGALRILDGILARIDSSGWSPEKKASYLIERVDLYRNMGRLDEAEADARRSIAICPKQVASYLFLADLARLRGKTAAEIQLPYDQMLEAEPLSADVHLRRAEFFRDQRRWDEAIAEVGQARPLDKRRDPALFDLALAGIDAARGDYSHATSEAEAVLSKVKRPDGPLLYEAACVWSLASREALKVGEKARANALADRAVGYLRTTLTDAYHDLEYPEKERMRFDPALEPIADRPEVKKLLSFAP